MLIQPDIRPIAARTYRVQEAWVVHWRGWTIPVPEGFQHDGASVPRLAWTFSGLTPDGLIRAAALAHDFAYRGFVPGMTRREADVMLYDLMVEAGISRPRAYVAWLGVRTGGWLSWKG